MDYKRTFFLLFFVFGILVFTTAQAQQVNLQDLSQIKVDELSDDQILNFIAQAESSGLSESQLIQMASAKGMPQTEIDKLQQRIVQLQNGNQTTAETKQAPARVEAPVNREVVADYTNDTLTSPETLAAKTSTRDTLRKRIYGADLFLNAHPVFEPNLKIATPTDYVVGTGDELHIDIYGQSEASYNLSVNPDGNINIPYVGLINVAGATMEEAIVRIRAKMAGIYKAIPSGGTKVAVTLGNIRSIHVTLTGEVVMPGTYTLPSVASVFNALYSSGGPTANGSLRSIRVIRGGTVIATLDLYDFLQSGSMKANINLRDQDVIQVEPYLSRVALIGAVKRPMLFETKPGETFADLLRYAGGFTEDAYAERISVIRNTGKDYRIEDLLASQFNQFEPRSGDQFTITRALDRFVNRVTLQGAVYRPGQYELSSGLTLSMLIKKADGLKEDAFLKRGYIIRLKDNLQREQVGFNVAEVLAGTQTDIPLKREDLVVIPSIFELKEDYTVEISGEVRKPGKYSYSEGMTLAELVLQAGGFTEAGSGNRVEIARRIHNSDQDALAVSARTAEIFQVNMSRDLSHIDSAVVLKPFDLIHVRQAVGYERQRTVRIEGEVLYPGEYTLTNKNERISDLIKRAGGFTPYAYVSGASLKRRTLLPAFGDNTSNTYKQEQAAKAALAQERLGRLENLQSTINSTTGSKFEQQLQNNYVGIDLAQIIDKPGKENDLLLEGGDIIRVPKQLQTVKISGEVLSPVTALYAGNKSFKNYISEAGGFSQQALKRRSFVVYANGSARSTKKILFFNNYPKIKPGSEIFVPQRLPRERLGATQLIGIGTGLASLAAIVVSLLR